MMQPKPGLPSLDGLRYFDAAARNLSFTRAAQDLFLTQSAVSQKIQSLEQQLGYLVFHRTPAGLRLTPQGEQLFIGGFHQQLKDFFRYSTLSKYLE